MMKHDKKDKIAIITGGLILLAAVLIAIYVEDKPYGLKLIVYAVITLGIGFIMPKALFVIEKKKTWLYVNRCKLNATTLLKHVVNFFATFITILMIYHLRYIDYAAIIVVGIIAGVLTALAEYFTSNKDTDSNRVKTYNEN